MRIRKLDTDDGLHKRFQDNRAEVLECTWVIRPELTTANREVLLTLAPSTCARFSKPLDQPIRKWSLEFPDAEEGGI